MTSPPKDAVDAWARRELKVGPDATPLEVRQAALRLVAAAKFAPTFDDSVAIGVALGRPRDVVDAFQKEAYYSRDEEALRHAIDSFAKGFFGLSFEERAKRWSELDRWAVVFPWWRSRLAILKKGLTITAPSGDATTLAHDIADMFVVSPAERAARRREAIDWLPRDERDAAIAEVNREHPELAKLAGLNKSIAEPTTPRKGGGGYSPPAPIPQAQSNRRWVPFIAFFVVMFFIRVLTSGTSSTAPPKFTPAWQPPANEWNPNKNPVIDIPNRREPFDFNRDLIQLPDDGKPKPPKGLESFPQFKID